MPCYFFDVQDGYSTQDTEGTALDSTDEVAAMAMKTLFEVGQLEVMRNDVRELTITVRDETGAPVYRAELMIRAGWLSPAK